MLLVAMPLYVKSLFSLVNSIGYLDGNISQIFYKKIGDGKRSNKTIDIIMKILFHSL